MGGWVFSEKYFVFYFFEGLLIFYNFWMMIVIIYNNIIYKSDLMIDIWVFKKKIKKLFDLNLIFWIWIDFFILIDENMINDGFFYWSMCCMCI